MSKNKQICCLSWIFNFCDVYFIIRKVMIVMARKGKDRNSIKKRRRLLILGTFSLTTIVFTTYTMGKYWVQIYDKKQERDKLSQELKKLKKIS